jgi:hypothetical protein
MQIDVKNIEKFACDGDVIYKNNLIRHNSKKKTPFHSFSLKMS